MTNPAKSALAVRAYKILPYDFAGYVGYALPVVEILVGLLLVVGLLHPRVRGGGRPADAGFHLRHQLGVGPRVLHRLRLFRRRGNHCGLSDAVPTGDTARRGDRSLCRVARRSSSHCIQPRPPFVRIRRTTQMRPDASKKIATVTPKKGPNVVVIGAVIAAGGGGCRGGCHRDRQQQQVGVDDCLRKLRACRCCRRHRWRHPGRPGGGQQQGAHPGRLRGLPVPGLWPVREDVRPHPHLDGQGRAGQVRRAHDVLPGRQPQQRLLEAGDERGGVRGRRGQVRGVPLRGIRGATSQGG